MKVLMYSVHDYERPYLLQANQDHFDTDITKIALTDKSATMAQGYNAISISSTDGLPESVLKGLHDSGIRFITIRSTDIANADLYAADKMGICITAVPPYGPYAIAEHAVALMLALNRKLLLADKQVRAYNFALDNLIGFNLFGKTVGIIGMGRVGRCLARILDGFGCNLLGFDLSPDPDLEQALSVTFADLDTICSQADILTLHVSLNEQTRHLIDSKRIALMKKGVMLINTSRGSVIRTNDVLQGLEQGKIGYFGGDVYEHEDELFAQDHSNNLFKADALLNRFLELPNVLITPHQSYATQETMQDIADATFYNLKCFMHAQPCRNEVRSLQNRSHTHNDVFVRQASGQ